MKDPECQSLPGIEIWYKQTPAKTKTIIVNTQSLNQVNLHMQNIVTASTVKTIIQFIIILLILARLVNCICVNCLKQKLSLNGFCVCHTMNEIHLYLKFYPHISLHLQDK